MARIGVRGLLRYIEAQGYFCEGHDASAVRRIDLAAEARNRRCEGDSASKTPRVLLDLHGACLWLVRRRWAEISSSPSAVGKRCLCLGNYSLLDYGLEALAQGLERRGIIACFFVDTPPGAGLLDQCCPVLLEANRARFAKAAQAAGAAARWCSHAGVQPERPPLPPLWLEQAVATLTRLGHQVVFLEPKQQVPLWKFSEEDFASAVVSDDSSWCLMPGIRLVTYSNFDPDGDLQLSGGPQGPEERLTVRYTSIELLLEALRLEQAPQHVHDLRSSASAETTEGAKANWKPGQLLRELALLCGTEATIPGIRRQDLYRFLQIQDLRWNPVKRLAEWLTAQICSASGVRQLRWDQEFQLEDLNIVIDQALRDDPELRLAFKFQRLVFARDVNGIKSLHEEWNALRNTPERPLKLQGATPPPLLGPARAVAMGAAELFLEPTVEVGAAGGGAWEAVAGLRRLAYSCMVPEMWEHRPCKTGTRLHKLALETSLQGSLQDLWSTWSTASRLRAFTRCTEHHLLCSQEVEEKKEAESVVWEDVEQSLTTPAGGYLRVLFSYLLSLNSRPHGLRLAPHELDTLICTTVLSMSTEDPLSPVNGCSKKVSRRLAMLHSRAQQLAMLASESPGGVRVPARVSQLAAVLQAAMQGLSDLVRVLGLNRGLASTDLAQEEDDDMLQAVLAQGNDKLPAAPVRLPEPKDVFANGQLLTGMWCAGAKENGERLEIADDADGAKVKGYLNDLVALRSEVLYHMQGCGDWVTSLADKHFPEKFLRWPDAAELRQEEPVSSSAEVETTIERRRERIVSLAATRPVTFITGQPGCGKSIYVPLFLLDAPLPKEPGAADVPFASTPDAAKPCVLSVQPGCAACLAHAGQLARALGQNVGATVGYNLESDSMAQHWTSETTAGVLVSDHTRLVFTTSKTLLELLLEDSEYLRRFSYVIFDEAHDRSVHSDVLHTLLKHLLFGPGPRRGGRFRTHLVLISSVLQMDTLPCYYQAPLDSVAPNRAAEEPSHPAATSGQAALGGAWGSDSTGKTAAPITVTRCGAPPHAVQILHLEDLAKDSRFSKKALDNMGKVCKQLLSVSVPDTPRPRKLRLRKCDDPDFLDESSGCEDDDTGRNLTPAPARAHGADRCPIAVSDPQTFHPVVSELLKAQLEDGDVALVILPRHVDVVNLEKYLLPLAETKEAAQPQIRVIAVHPLADAEKLEAEVLKGVPASGTARIILAAACDAESWPTVPAVRLVIDFGLSHCEAYDVVRRASTSKISWASQATCIRRAGFTGRARPGTCVRLYTKAFFCHGMRSFDEPEMTTASPARLALEGFHFVSKMSVHLDQRLSFSQYCRQTPCSLQHTDFNHYAAELGESGIMVTPKGKADFEVTIFGKVLRGLQLEPRFARLVVLGCCFGVPCDALVMAAGLSMEEPFLSTVSGSAQTDLPGNTWMASGAAASLSARRRCDAGHLSEPLALRSLFILWLRGLMDYRASVMCADEAIRSIIDGSIPDEDVAQGVSGESCVCFALRVADLARRLEKLLPPGGASHRALRSLLSLLQVRSDPDGEQDSQITQIEDLFCTDPWRLKVLLACAFSPQFMVGQPNTDNKAGNSLRCKKFLADFLRYGLDPSLSIALPLLGQGQTSADETMVQIAQSSLQSLAERPAVHAVASEDGHYILAELNEEMRGKLAKSAETAEDEFASRIALDREGSIPQQLPQAAQHLSMLALGHTKYKLPCLQHRHEGEGDLIVGQLFSPYLLAWETLQASSMKIGGEVIGKLATCDWRGLFGKAASCRIDPDDFLAEDAGPNNLPLPAQKAVVACYAATPKSIGVQDHGSTLRVWGTTVFGVDADNLLSIVLMFAFLRRSSRLEFEVDQSSEVVEAVHIGHKEIRFRDLGPKAVLLLEDLDLINALREAISQAIDALVVQTASTEESEDAAGSLQEREAVHDVHIHAVETALEHLLAALRDPHRLVRRPREAAAKLDRFSMHATTPSQNMRFLEPLTAVGGYGATASTEEAATDAKAEIWSDWGCPENVKHKIPIPPPEAPPAKRAKLNSADVSWEEADDSDDTWGEAWTGKDFTGSSKGMEHQKDAGENDVDKKMKDKSPDWEDVEHDSQGEEEPTEMCVEDAFDEVAVGEEERTEAEPEQQVEANTFKLRPTAKGATRPPSSARAEPVAVPSRADVPDGPTEVGAPTSLVI